MDTKPQTSPELVDFKPINDRLVRVRFRGPFEGRVVTWQADVIALEPGNQEKAYIDLPEGEGDTRKISIGLPANKIDRPTIFKVMMMIRQYRNLSVGRHEWST